MLVSSLSQANLATRRATVLTERDKDHFQAILTRLVELNISTQDVLVERWAIVGMFASLNPAEDLYLQMRTGFQIDAARRKPTVYRADLADAVAKSAIVSQFIITLITKLYNKTQRPMKNEILWVEAMNCHRFYACEFVSITKAAMMFHEVPHPSAGMLNKAYQLTYAYMGALEQSLVSGRRER